MSYSILEKFFVCFLKIVYAARVNLINFFLATHLGVWGDSRGFWTGFGGNLIQIGLLPKV